MRFDHGHHAQHGGNDRANAGRLGFGAACRYFLERMLAMPQHTAISYTAVSHKHPQSCSSWHTIGSCIMPQHTQPPPWSKQPMKMHRSFRINPMSSNSVLHV